MKQNKEWPSTYSVAYSAKSASKFVLQHKRNMITKISYEKQTASYYTGNQAFKKDRSLRVGCGQSWTLLTRFLVQITVTTAPMRTEAVYVFLRVPRSNAGSSTLKEATVRWSQHVSTRFPTPVCLAFRIHDDYFANITNPLTLFILKEAPCLWNVSPEF
jgi:hypothetical protein